MMATPMASGPPAVWTRVDALCAGDLVRYNSRVYTVAEVLMIAEPLTGRAVVGIDMVTGLRAVLIYANGPHHTAERVGAVTDDPERLAALNGERFGGGR